MKKILAVIPLTILFILLSNNQSVLAARIRVGSALNTDAAWTGNPNGVYDAYADINDASDLYPYERNSGYLYVGYGSNASYLYSLYWYDPIGDRYLGLSTYNTRVLYLENSNFQPVTLTSSSGTTYCYSDYDEFVENLPPEYRPEEPSEPTWWDLVKDYLFGFGDEPLWDLIPDLWDLWFGFHLDGDDVQYGEPIEYIDPPSPTPFPTQIPYQTIINPSGEVTYKYIGPSGVPITATAPPPEPTYTIIITDYPKYDVSGVPVPPDEGLNDIIDSLDDTVTEYQEGLSVVQNSMSVLPLKWFFFFGIPAAIIIIAGIIKSLLGG